VAHHVRSDAAGTSVTEFRGVNAEAEAYQSEQSQHDRDRIEPQARPDEVRAIVVGFNAQAFCQNV